MSDNNTAAFIELLNTDSTLRSKVQALPTGDLPALMRLAAEIGYAFTAEEWMQATAVFAGELDDAALDRVAGGALNAYLESPTMDSQAGNFMRSAESSRSPKSAVGERNLAVRHDASAGKETAHNEPPSVERTGRSRSR